MSNRKWTREELEAAVLAYKNFVWMEERGEKYSKAEVYRQLAARLGRTFKSIERRMMNISYVYVQMGKQFVPGLAPGKNVGAKLIPVLKELISEKPKIENYRALFDLEVSRVLKKPEIPKPVGTKKPAKREASATLIQRNPEVAAWILHSSNGICECCGDRAPFSKNDGSHYLEIHHLKRLADGGSDQIQNAIAACPNCHRELHYGAKREKILPKLYRKIDRLVKE